MFDILSWNIQQGGGRRVMRIIKALAEIRPEVVALSEFRNNETGLRIRANLLKLGYRYQFATHASKNTNSSFIASRYPCSSQLFPGCDPEYDHSIVCVNFPAFDVYSVYFPHKKKHRLFDFLVDEQLDRNRPSIITGDYNSGRNGIDQKGNSFWYSEYFDALEELDFVDGYRSLHGDKRTYSWYSHKGNGFRYDHTYLSDSLIPFLKSCDYLHEWRTSGLSDHSPMYLTLNV